MSRQAGLRHPDTCSNRKRAGKSPVTTRELRRLGNQAPDVFPLIKRYAAAQDFLHGDCFYLGLCEPVEDTEGFIRGASNYIRDAESLS